MIFVSNTQRDWLIARGVLIEDNVPFTCERLSYASAGRALVEGWLIDDTIGGRICDNAREAVFSPSTYEGITYMHFRPAGSELPTGETAPGRASAEERLVELATAGPTDRIIEWNPPEGLQPPGMDRPRPRAEDLEPIAELPPRPRRRRGDRPTATVEVVANGIAGTIPPDPFTLPPPTIAQPTTVTVLPNTNPTVDPTAAVVDEENRPIPATEGTLPMAIPVISPPEKWDGLNQQLYLSEAAEIFAPVYSRIRIEVPNGEPEMPKDCDHELNIFVWSSPDEKAQPGAGKDLTPPEKIFGKKVDCRDDSFAPSKKATVVIKDPDTGYEIAEFVAPNHLYIMFDAVQRSTKASHFIWQKILTTFIETVGVDVLKKHGSSLAEKRREEERRALMVYVTKSLGTKKDQLLKLVEQRTATIDKLSQDLVTNLRARQYDMDALAGIGKYDADAAAKKMVTDIMSDVNVETVGIEKEIIFVITKDLTFKDPRNNKTHALGRMKMLIDCERGNVKFENLTRKVQAFSGQQMNAPHVFQDGRPCWGDIQNDFIELYARYDVANIVAKAILFLTLGINTDDPAGTLCHRWPLIKEDGTLSEWKDRPAASRGA